MNTIDFLKANENKGHSTFISKAEYLRDNWLWLRYSYAIAIKVRGRMRALGITQKELATMLGCTQQHISVLLAGRSNMTLETLAKLEHALAFDLIGHVLKEFSDAGSEETSVMYLNDSGSDGLVQDGFQTSNYVDGYKPRKKKGPKTVSRTNEDGPSAPVEKGSGR